MSKTKTPIMDLETDEDGWIGGSSQSIYARKPEPSTPASPPSAAKHANKPSPVTPGRDESQSAHAKTGSLLERMDMAQNLQQTPPRKGRKGKSDDKKAAGPTSTPSAKSNAASSAFENTPSPGIRRPGAKLPSPLPLTSPARNNDTTSPLNTRTPLSASHPIPETPLKLSQRGGPQTPATPHWPLYPNTARLQNQDADSSRTSGLGLGLTPLKQSVPLASSPDTGRSSLNEALNLRGRAGSIGSPLKSSRNGSRGEPLALDAASSNGKTSNDQIDAMLDRVRNTRSGLGTSASMWAPKPAVTSDNDSSASNNASASTTSHTIGSGFTSSNLLGVQTGLDRKRPGHRHNGLQLSLGQEISVMQNVEENAEDDAPSSAAAEESFKLHPPDNQAEHEAANDWNGNVVPPTPALGCDSPSSDEGKSSSTKPPSRSLDAFGWGGKQPQESSLFSNLPSSSTLEANWSGDDDDERKDDVEMFEDMQNRAKASTKERRNSNYGPLPPPPINFAKSRTPSPTHRMLAKSPQLDKPTSSDLQKSPSLTASKLGSGAGNGKPLSQRLSPASARSQLHSDDSDGDADVENEKPKGAKDRKSSKKHDSKGEQGPKTDSLQVDGGKLEKKRSLKRDKSERIRGRRASQSKEKDGDRVKVPASGTATGASSADANTTASAKVSLPTSSRPSSNADDLAASVEKVNLSESTTDEPIASIKDPNTTATKPDAQQTPVANRVQSIPTVKDDLFSSPAAEPKVGLPSNKPSPAQPEEEGSKSPVSATPEPTQSKTFDWAADDDELDDELPDLDDWGVTLSPAKPASTPTFSSADDKAHSKAKSEGGEEKVWRRGTKLPAPAGKAKPPKTNGADDGLGIRIAGRAKSATPEPAQPPPASTPYGRWKQPKPAEEITIKGASAKTRPRIADLGSLAKLMEPTEPKETGAKDSMHAPPTAPAAMREAKGRSPLLGAGRGGAKKGRGGKK